MTLYLVLYLSTLVVHVALVSYVLVGAGWLAVAAARGRPREPIAAAAPGSVAAVPATAREDDPIAATFRDWLPFAIGAAITAGVAPLLFVQVLYQERFYTANLLLAYRWLAVVPALIIGFYAAYLGKSKRVAGWHPRWRAAIATIGALAFLFVAWSWTEEHLLSLRPERWTAMYGAGRMTYFEPALPPRLLLWLGLSAPSAATLLTWQLRAPAALRTLRTLALAGLLVAAAAAAWLYTTLDAPARDALLGGPGTGLAFALALTELALALTWLRIPRAPHLRRVATLALAAALVLGALLRERLRLPAFTALHPRAASAGGFPAFVAFFALNVGLLIWCLRAALRHLRTTPGPAPGQSPKS